LTALSATHSTGVKGKKNTSAGESPGDHSTFQGGDMAMQPGLFGSPYGTQGIGTVPSSGQLYGQPLQQILQSLQFVPYQLQQLHQIELMQHQQVQQLLQVIPSQLQQLQQTIQLIAQQIPGLQQSQWLGQSPWAGLSQTAGYGVPFQPSSFGAFGQPGQVM
jgi:hypothetical protein